MRIDKHLQPVTLGLNRRQHYFLSAWFNLIHKQSLDSYRVRVMNPLNVMREFIKMYEHLHADDRDRKVVAEEMLEILGQHPVLVASFPNYRSIDDVERLLNEAVRQKKSSNGETSLFKSKSSLIRAFVRELDASLQESFLTDALDWLSSRLSEDHQNESEEQEIKSLGEIERVCRDILSVAHDDGFSLESLYALYRLMSSTEEKGADETVLNSPYNFAARLARVRGVLLTAPKSHCVFFSIGGMPAPITQASGQYGDIIVSDQAPAAFAGVPEKITSQGRWKKSWTTNNQRLFAWVELVGKDGRSAGMSAYEKIGQLLDLIRFEFDAKNLRLSTEFVVSDGEKFLLLTLPEAIPNPKPASSRDLGNFVKHLDEIAIRDAAETESKDRIIAAFRFYRIGTDVSLFENKLVNWWTAIEYLTKGSKAGGAIGDAVVGALVPSLGLPYVSKHLSALRAALVAFGQPIGQGDLAINPEHLTDLSLYSLLKEPQQLQLLASACRSDPYLWHHLNKISSNLQSERQVAAFLRGHERRLRWQVQRIYRARCDIVHSAQSVVMIALLCANLEYYLRVILSSMLISFKEVPTLLGPSEFFERNIYSYSLLLSDLDPSDRNMQPSQALLMKLLPCG